MKLTSRAALVALSVLLLPTPAAHAFADAASPRPRSAAPPVCGTEIAGHRGSPRTAPENTMASFTAAVREGADWLETDVLTTKDGVPVLFHDPTVDRVTGGTGKVQDFTYDELSKLRVTIGPGPAQPIPKLSELLDWLSGTHSDTRLLLELKELRAPEDAATIGRMAAASGAHVELYSFYANHLRTAHEAAPLLPVTLVQGSWYAEDPGALPLTAVSLEYLLATPQRVSAEHTRHRSVYAWILDDPDSWTGMTGAGVDTIITDTPGAARAWLDKACAKAVAAQAG